MQRNEECGEEREEELACGGHCGVRRGACPCLMTPHKRKRANQDGEEEDEEEEELDNGCLEKLIRLKMYCCVVWLSFPLGAALSTALVTAATIMSMEIFPEALDRLGEDFGDRFFVSFMLIKNMVNILQIAMIVGNFCIFFGILSSSGWFSLWCWKGRNNCISTIALTLAVVLFMTAFLGMIAAMSFLVLAGCIILMATLFQDGCSLGRAAPSSSDICLAWEDTPIAVTGCADRDDLADFCTAWESELPLQNLMIIMVVLCLSQLSLLLASFSAVNRVSRLKKKNAQEQKRKRLRKRMQKMQARRLPMLADAEEAP
ncbi:hypothetical protein QOT17_012417 [Balamuthia mandrillaris]